MPIQIYSDAALTTQLSGGLADLIATQHSDGSTDPVDFQLWIGDTDSNYQYQADSDPGVDQIAMAIEYQAGVWQASTAQVVDDVVRPTVDNNYKYAVQSISGGGATGASEPTWPTTVGNTVVDNEVTWVCLGELHDPAEVKLATTEVGLDSATGGASLNLALTITGGVANAVEFWVRVDDTTLYVDNSDDLKIRPNLVRRTAV